MIFHGQQALDIAQGNDRNGLSQVNLIGRNADIDIGTEDIWDGGGDYTPMASAAALHVSSSNNGDNTQTITITGLDANGIAQTEDIALAGQTETAGTKTWTAVHSCTLDAACAGDVYAYIDDTVTAGVPDTATKIRAKVIAGNLNTYMAVYMIPANHNGFLIEYGGSHSGIQLWKIPAIGGTAEWVENLNGYRQAPLYLPAGTFIKLRYTATADNQDVRAAATIILRKA